jgi:hypothetical protein
MRSGRIVKKKFHYLLLFATVSIVHGAIFGAQVNPKPENATPAVLRAFETHNIVMIGEIHSNKQEYDWFRSLVATPEFADRVDDIVLEMGNSLFGLLTPFTYDCQDIVLIPTSASPMGRCCIVRPRPAGAARARDRCLWDCHQ